MTLDTGGQQLGVTGDVGVDGLVAQNVLAQCLVALLHRLAEGWVLQQSLPHRGCGVVACSLEVPCLRIVGVGEVRVSVGQVIVPYGACHQLATRTIGVLLLLVEIGTAFVAVGIEAQLRVDKVVYERGHVDVTGITALGVSERGGLNYLLHRVHIVADIVELLWL